MVRKQAKFLRVAGASAMVMAFLLSCNLLDSGKDEAGGPAGSTVGMTLIRAGTFSMGGTSTNEQPVHAVTLPAFWMDITEVTQADFEDLMILNPANFMANTKRPVEKVTWFDAALYCNERSKKEGLDTVYRYTSVKGSIRQGYTALDSLAIDYTKKGYRLPTEAEWEYACRAGTTTDYYWGEDSTGDYAWYKDNGVFTTHPVAEKLPNAWGLYDMSGNVWEWVNDWYDSTYYAASPARNPQGPASGTNRVMRGGSWGDLALLRSASRGKSVPGVRSSNIGFRCVRPK